METAMTVVLLEKLKDGELKQVDVRSWTMNMVSSLEHVNYLVVGGQEYETIEGRLNVDEGTLELLVVAMKNH